jgi:hypothetical protein
LDYTKYSDLTITEDGDLAMGPGGDLYILKGIPSLRQDIEFRLKTDLGDLLTQPKIGSRLRDMIGRRNTKEVAEQIKTEITNCLTYGNFIDPGDLNVSAIPVDESTIICHIEVSADTYVAYRFDLIYDLENGIRRV